MRNFFFAFLFLFESYISFAQETFPLIRPQEKTEEAYAFINATIIPSAGIILKNATLLIRKGIISSIGTEISIPPDVQIIDLQGLYIYPSFIDLYSIYGLPKNTLKNEHSRNSFFSKNPQYNSSVKGAWYWNEAIRSEIKSISQFKNDEASAEKLRKAGFGVVLSHSQDGIVRGSSVLTLLSDMLENDNIISNETTVNLSFKKGSSKQEYPNSLMGSIALLNQFFIDAEWYKKTWSVYSKNSTLEKPEINFSLQSYNDINYLPHVFEVDEKYNLLQADKIGDEFNIQFIFKGSGDEYERMDEIKKTNGKLIIPINLPKPYDVENPYEASYISLNKLRHWELAKFNPVLLQKQGIEFAITATGHEEINDFWKNLRICISAGWDQNDALRSLTLIPAKLIKQDKLLGTLEKGKMANFLISSGNIFKKDEVIYENWIKGKSFIIKNRKEKNISGNYTLKFSSLPKDIPFTGKRKDSLLLSDNFTMIIDGKYSPSIKIKIKDSTFIKVRFTQKGNDVNLSFEPFVNAQQSVRLTGVIEDSRKDSNTIKGQLYFYGKGQLSDGNWFDWRADWDSVIVPKKGKTKKDSLLKPSIPELLYPNVAYGFKTLPKSQTTLFKNITCWTNEKEGILKGYDILIQNGKIININKTIPPPVGCNVIDGIGKHLTSGIIDEHSHIAIMAGVNESGKSVTAEVSISNVIFPDDVNIYRQLAGGVTSAQLLHGSANVIGGQSAIIKLRWGYSPEGMKNKDAPGFIKFALGENVKQSNWGDRYTVRYPQTRMGVEQIHKDAFQRAKEYKEEWSNYLAIPEKNRSTVFPPRKDLQLDCLVEILDNKRFITCHSYVQSEINQLMKTSTEMGFRVNTFTHILEGYKVADKMKQYGVGASTFADWWGYKYEVMEAIPHNASLLNSMGVVTAINSDDAEMGRRLNQEAAKTIKYGNTSEEDAWKMVTLNPAKLLHIDHKTGSIKPGKDADLVVWSDNPLSVYAKVEQTYVDGILFFDLDTDKKLREENQKERARIIQLMMDAKNKGEKTQNFEKKDDSYSCFDF